MSSKIAAGILMAMSVGAQGQQAQNAQPPHPATRVSIPTAAPALPPDVVPNVLWQAALQAAQLIDQAQTAVLWQQASAAARSKVTAEAFSKGVMQSRAGLGTVTQRRWATLNLQQTVGGSALPPGEYFGCEFIASFSSGRTLHELVSLRLDEDNVWRFAGYALR
jgi:Protein of unknown function (DUF4019)